MLAVWAENEKNLTVSDVSATHGASGVVAVRLTNGRIENVSVEAPLAPDVAEALKSFVDRNPGVAPTDVAREFADRFRPSGANLWNLVEKGATVASLVDLGLRLAGLQQ